MWSHTVIASEAKQSSHSAWPLDCFVASLLAMTIPSRQPRNAPRSAGQLQNMQPGVGAVDDIDVAALVGLDVVGLDRCLAAVLAVDGDAALVGGGRDRRNEIADFLRVIGIADIERANAGIEEGDKGHLLVKHRRHALVGRMRAEAPAPLAERAA